MNFKKMLTDMVPWLQKDDVVTTYSATLKDLEGLNATLANVVNVLADTNKKPVMADTLESTFLRNYSGKKYGNKLGFLFDVRNAMPLLIANFGLVGVHIKDDLPEDIIKDGLNVKRLFCMRAADHLEFTVDYLGKLIRYTLVEESKRLAEKSKQELTINDVAPYYEKELISNIVNFAKILSVYTKEPKKFHEDLDAIPDVLVTAKNHDMVEIVSYATGKVDPASSVAPTGFSYSPIYYVRMRIAEYQASNHKYREEKKRELEARLLYLQLQYDEEPNPGLEKEINYLQGRVEDIEDKLRKYS